jgi:hypothetical protein
MMSKRYSYYFDNFDYEFLGSRNEPKWIDSESNHLWIFVFASRRDGKNHGKRKDGSQFSYRLTLI